jgi:hypothetical protein
VAVLLAVSIGDLRPSPQDASAFYLQNIFQLLSDPNRSNPTILSTPSIPPAFSPPKYAVWVNSLWFLSLAISLTCGFQATLLQQWARRYINITQSSHSAHGRARIRAFFFKGVDTLHLPLVVEALPTLLHLSLFLFFAGLAIYLFNINHTVFTVVAWWVGLCTATYIGVTLMPLFRHDSPYYAPLSSSAWYLVNGALCAILNSLNSPVTRLLGYESRASSNIYDLVVRLWNRFHFGIRWAIEDAAERQSSEADHSAVERVFTFSDEDPYLEEFFALIPGFVKSKVVKDAGHIHIFKNGQVSGSLLEFLNRTLSSHILSDVDKQRRIAICRKVMDVASLSIDYFTLGLAFNNWNEILCSIDSGLVLKAASYNHPPVLHLSQSLISVILERVKTRDDNWCKLATGHLGVSESVLRVYLANGDSASLANLNCVLRRAIDFHSKLPPFYMDDTTNTLERFSKIDVQGTLPELRHEFCTLWNQLVLDSQTNENRFLYCPTDFLARIRYIYITLHHGTASTPIAFSASTANNDPILLRPSSYPFCTVADHYSGSAFHRDVDGPTEMPARTSPTLDTPTNVDALSSPTPSPNHANLSPSNKPSLDDIPAASRRIATPILAPAHMSPVNDEGHHSPVNPFDSTTTLVIRNGIYADTLEHTANSSSRTSLLRATSTPMLPLSSISHSNSITSPQQDEESTAVPLSTFKYLPSSSIPSFTRNAPLASTCTSLSASTGDRIPAILVFLPPHPQPPLSYSFLCRSLRLRTLMQLQGVQQLSNERGK